MANYMFVLRPMEMKFKTVCSECANRGEVLTDCCKCHGAGVTNKTNMQYCVKNVPIKIVKVDRDPKTGILRYWENSSEFYHETTYHEMNEYVPDVPYGVHLCHDDLESAKAECIRINEYLHNKAKQPNKPVNKSYLYNTVEI